MLQGSGEPLHELRQFVKDLRFRNRQEASLGDLDVIDKKLELALKYGLMTADEAREIVRQALHIENDQRALPLAKREAK